MDIVIVKMKIVIKKAFTLFLVFAISLQFVSYAKVNPFEKEVEAPVAEEKTHKSNGIIISESRYHEYNPINPIKSGVVKEEYDKVDNYIIDLSTLEYRIKYFSPTYLNIKSSAESMYWVGFYARGGNDYIVYDMKKYTGDVDDLMKSLKSAMAATLAERSKYPETDPKYKELTAAYANYSGMYVEALTMYKTMTMTKSALGLSRALYNIGNVDNNNQVAFARRAVTKTIKSLVLTYLQLSSYAEILEKQSKLYYDMYVLKNKNLTLGLATSLEVKESLDAHENAKTSFKTTKTTLTNLKEQIAINLGYKVSEVDKLVFVEPEVDLASINSVNFEEDKKRAYTSNSAYNSVSLSDKDKKLPQSTGEEIFFKRQDYNAEKVITEFENIYRNLQAKIFAYEGSIYLTQIVALNESANLRKFNNKLISELEYKGLEIQNLANALQVKTAKYDLINAYNDYYYGALGHITIS